MFWNDGFVKIVNGDPGLCEETSFPKYALERGVCKEMRNALEQVKFPCMCPWWVNILRFVMFAEFEYKLFAKLKADFFWRRREVLHNGASYIFVVEEVCHQGNHWADASLAPTRAVCGFIEAGYRDAYEEFHRSL